MELALVMTALLAIVYYLHRLTQHVHDGSRRQDEQLQLIANNSAMLFYAVEQIYEMSPVHPTFATKKRWQEPTRFGPRPHLDVDDEASTEAWATLASRMQERMEAVYESQARASTSSADEVFASKDGPEADQVALHDNQQAWTLRMPMLAGWPISGNRIVQGKEGRRHLEEHVRARGERRQGDPDNSQQPKNDDSESGE